jgi:hypothetical protein
MVPQYASSKLVAILVNPVRLGRIRYEQANHPFSVQNFAICATAAKVSLSGTNNFIAKMAVVAQARQSKSLMFA